MFFFGWRKRGGATGFGSVSEIGGIGMRKADSDMMETIRGSVEQSQGQTFLCESHTILPQYLPPPTGVESRTSLTTGNWAPLTGTTQSDTGNERTITDTTTDAQKFYRVNVSKP